jgi:5'-methylthioadenosine phosphorylase
MMTDMIPQTPFALLSGSAQWGLAFPDDLREPGVKVVDRGLRFDTPWGPTENWQVIEIDAGHTGDGKSRTILNVFSHGWPVDAIDHSTHRKVAWVLSQAGVRKILADSTCGSLNKFLKPRDFIIPRDVLDFSQTQFSLLGGRLRHLCSSRQMFCPNLAGVLEKTATELWPLPGRVIGHEQNLVAVHNWGPRFASRAEAHAYQTLGGDAMNQSIGPEASAAREIGACFISASFIVCFQDGILEGVTDEVDQIHKDLAHVSSRISLLTMMRASLTTECGCEGLHVRRPAEYAVNAQGGERSHSD